MTPAPIRRLTAIGPNLLPLLATLIVAIRDGMRIATIDVVDLMRSYPADDAFYYLRLARSFPIAEVTNGIVTTGFHPLYWIVLAPIGRTMSGANGARGLLVLCLVLHVAAGWIVRAAIRRRDPTRPVVASFAGAIWIASPMARGVSLAGVEAALVAVCLAGVLWVVARPDANRSSWWTMIGVGVGLSYLARNDSVIVTGAMVGALVAFHRPQHLGRAVVRAGGSALAVASPWIVFLVARDSFPRQDSARAMVIGASTQWSDGVESVVRTLADSSVRLVGVSMGGIRAGDVAVRLAGFDAARPLLWGVLGAAVAAAGAAAVLRAVRTNRALPELAGVAGVLLLALVHGLYLGGLRTWYLVYWFLVVIAVVVPLVIVEVDALLRSTMRRQQHVARTATRTLGIVVVAGFALQSVPATYPQEADKYLAAQVVVARALRPNEIASLNTGVYNWYIGADVLNVDGVVNREVHRALEHAGLCHYLEARGIRYLLDDPDSVASIRRLAPGIVFETRERLSRSFPAGHRVVAEQDLVRVRYDCRASG